MKLITTLSLWFMFFSANAQYAFNEIEIWPGSLPGLPRYFTEMNGELFFQGYNNYNYELWKSDGTQSGTSLVADLNGTASSSPQSITEFNGMLIFTAAFPGLGNELWKSDGTNTGTSFLKDIRPGSSSGFESTTTTFNGDRETFLEFGNELFFFGNTGNGIELWKTDGSAAGTVSVKNFTQGTIFGNAKYSSNRERETLGVIFNNELYFIVIQSSPVPVNFRGELWKTDGTTAGTVMVKDSLHASVNSLVVANNKMYFVNETSANGNELWSSNGTTVGTVLEADINPNGDSDPKYLTPFNGELYFSARGSLGTELYKTDGAITTLVKDVFPGTGGTLANSGLGLARFFEYNGLLYFLAEDATSGGDNELWQTDGTLVGTIKALSLPQVGGFIEFLNPIIYDNRMFYRTSGQLWATDGTPSNTQQLTDNGNPSEPISQVSHLAIFQQDLWFAGANTSNGVEAWYLGSPPPTTIDASACTSYTVPSGDETYTNSGMYSDTVMSSQGNDSILIINLTINQPTSASINAQTCDVYISPSGNYSWSVAGTYTDTLTNSFGCDSIITINLTVLTSSSTIDENACTSYISPSGNNTWTTSGLYYDTLVNAAGCDSVISINLTINPVDATVQSNMGTLEASSTASNYQWLNCDNNFAIISGETNQSFTPVTSGNYAVQITEGNCVDTSDCFFVDVMGVGQLNQYQISVYPNPTQGTVIVESELWSPIDRILILNGLGQIVHQAKVDGLKTNIDLPTTPGVYVLKYKGDHVDFTARISRI